MSCRYCSKVIGLLFKWFMDQVRIELGAVERRMSQEGLYPFQGHPALQQVGGDAVAKRVRADLFGNACFSNQGLDPQVQALLMDGPALVCIQEEHSAGSLQQFRPALFDIIPDIR